MKAANQYAVRRTPGWSVLAEIAWELAALSLAAHAMEVRDHQSLETVPASVTAPAVDVPIDPPGDSSDPCTFIDEPADAAARYYRLAGEGFEGFAGLYSDGRVRIADAHARRFAGALANGRADLLQLATDSWSELLVQTTPSGETQFELRGGAFGSLVLAALPLQR